jgi:hypothetical protein
MIFLAFLFIVPAGYTVYHFFHLMQQKNIESIQNIDKYDPLLLID